MRHSKKTNSFINQINKRNRLFIASLLSEVKHNKFPMLKKLRIDFSFNSSTPAYLSYFQTYFKPKRSENVQPLLGLMTDALFFSEKNRKPATYAAESKPIENIYSKLVDFRFISIKNRLSYYHSSPEKTIKLIKFLRVLLLLCVASVTILFVFLYFYTIRVFFDFTFIESTYFLKYILFFYCEYLYADSLIFLLSLPQFDFASPLSSLSNNLSAAIQIVFRGWEDHILAWEFFYQLEFLTFYWFFVIFLILYFGFVAILGLFAWKFLIYRYDFWGPTIKLFYHTDYLRAIPEMSATSQFFREQTPHVLQQSSTFFKASPLSVNQKRFLFNYNLSLGLGGFVGFIDFFPSYDAIFSRRTHTKRRTRAYRLKLLKLLKSLRFYGIFSFRHVSRLLRRLPLRPNYLLLGRNILTNRETLPKNLFSIPRYKPTLRKSAILTVLKFLFTAVSNIGDLGSVNLREYAHFLLNEPESTQLTRPDDPGLSMEHPNLLMPGTLVDWYHKELMSVILARTLDKPAKLLTKNLFNFGWHSIVNRYSFWQLNDNPEGKFSKISLDQFSHMDEYEDDSDRWLGGFTLYKQKETLERKGVRPSKFLEDNPEAVIQDKSEEMFFEDGFLHEDVDSVNIEEEENFVEQVEDIKEENTNYLSQQDPADKSATFWDEFTEEPDPEDLTPELLLNHPLVSSGAGQETDYFNINQTSANPFLSSDFDDTLAYSKQALFSSFYEDISDFYWLTTSDATYKNFAEYPVARFFNPLVVETEPEVDESILRRLTGGRLMNFFTPFLSRMLFLAFDLARLDFFIGFALGFMVINGLLFLTISGALFDNTLGIWNPATISALYVLFALITTLFFLFAIVITKTTLSALIAHCFSTTFFYFGLCLNATLFLFLGLNSTQKESAPFYTSLLNVSKQNILNLSQALKNKNMVLLLTGLKRGSITKTTYNLNAWFNNFSCLGSLKPFTPNQLFAAPSKFWRWRPNVNMSKIYLPVSYLDSAKYNNLSRIDYYFANRPSFLIKLSSEVEEITNQQQFLRQVFFVDPKIALYLQHYTGTSSFFYKKFYFLHSCTDLVFEDTNRFLIKNRLVSSNTKSVLASTALRPHRSFGLSAFSEASMFYSLLTKKQFNLLSNVQVSADLLAQPIEPNVQLLGASLRPDSELGEELWAENFDFFSTNLLGDNYALNSQTYTGFLRLLFSESFLTRTFFNRSSNGLKINAEHTFLSADINKLKKT